MSTVILIFHLLLAIALVAIILVQRSEGGGLGIGGGGGMSGFMTGRGTSNFLTRTTAILATAFICTSMLLAYLGQGDNRPISILEVEDVAEPEIEIDPIMLDPVLPTDESGGAPDGDGSVVPVD